MVVEHPIPDYTGYFARDDGTIRVPSGRILRGTKTETNEHLMIMAKRDGHYMYPRYVHRLIALAFVYNPRPDIFLVVDHINRDPLDNRPCNLRWLTQQLNAVNNSSRGYYFNKQFKKYHARVTINGKSNHIGYFKTSYLAFQAARAFREQAFNAMYFKYIDEAFNRIYLKAIDEANSLSGHFFWKPTAIA